MDDLPTDIRIVSFQRRYETDKALVLEGVNFVAADEGKTILGVIPQMFFAKPAKQILYRAKLPFITCRPCTKAGCPGQQTLDRMVTFFGKDAGTWWNCRECGFSAEEREEQPNANGDVFVGVDHGAPGDYSAEVGGFRKPDGTLVVTHVSLTPNPVVQKTPDGKCEHGGDPRDFCEICDGD